MNRHWRANLLLLAFTVAICCVLYPALLYAIGRGLFPTATSGSLVDAKGHDTRADAKGSRLIAQPFTADEYFWPRPSAASYNATASGGSNWGANNPRLRDRVAQQLGPIAVYRAGSRAAGAGAEPRTPQKDLEAWFANVPDRVAAWASETVAPVNWAKTDLANDKYGLQGEYILAWANAHPEVRAEWKAANPEKTDEPKPEDLVGPFLASFAKAHSGKFPGIVELKQPDGTMGKRIEAVSSDAALHANFFDAWVSDPANADKVADLEPVAADMVMASGSGLDPHITLRNALSVYQIDRVTRKRVTNPADFEPAKSAIADLARSMAFTPLSGLTGEPLVNVLELNLALDARFSGK